MIRCTRSYGTHRTQEVMRSLGTIFVTLMALAACSQQVQSDLGTALNGIDKSRFLACSGPPSLEIPQGSQDRMWFVTNLKQGQSIGILSPVAAGARGLFGRDHIRECSPC